MNDLDCHVDYRPRLRYSSYQLSLKGITLTDHYQQDSQYPILAQPRNVMASCHKMPAAISFKAVINPSLSFPLPFSLSSIPLPLSLPPITLSFLPPFVPLSPFTLHVFSLSLYLPVCLSSTIHPCLFLPNIQSLFPPAVPFLRISLFIHLVFLEEAFPAPLSFFRCSSPKKRVAFGHSIPFR